MSEAEAGARYVVGFMFDETESNVILLWKNRPEWQRDKINGIGGRIEDGESAVEAMRRRVLGRGRYRSRGLAAVLRAERLPSVVHPLLFGYRYSWRRRAAH